MKVNSNRSTHPATVIIACFVVSNVAYANSLSSLVDIRVTNYTQQATYSSSDSGTDNQTRQVTLSRVGPTSDPSLYDTWTSSASALAKVDYGVLKLAVGSAVTNTGFSQSQSSISFIDELTFSNSGLTGQLGFLTASVLVSATSGATHGGTFLGGPPAGTAQTNWDLVVAADSNSVLTLQKSLWENPTFNSEKVNNAPGLITGVFTVQIPFRFGTPLALSAAASANSFAEYATASAFSDLGNSIYWGGIQSVSFNGEVVPYSLLAASGTDWSRSMAPVPEPSTYGMLLAGFGMLPFVVRRRLGSTTSV